MRRGGMVAAPEDAAGGMVAAAGWCGPSAGAEPSKGQAARRRPGWERQANGEEAGRKDAWTGGEGSEAPNGRRERFRWARGAA